MKNKLLKTMIVIGVFAFSMNLNAFNMNEPGGDCSGGSIDVCGSAQIAQLKDHAMLNCCSGSMIVWVDICDGGTGTIVVNQDGPNSSCAVE